MGNGGAFPGKALEELTASELAEGAARLGPSYAAALRSISMYVAVCALPSLRHTLYTLLGFPHAPQPPSEQDGRRREDEDAGTLLCSRSLPATALICSQRCPVVLRSCTRSRLPRSRFAPLLSASHRFLTHTYPLSTGSAGLAHDTRVALSKGTTLRTARPSRQH